VGNVADCQDLEDFLDRLDYHERELDIYPGFPHGFLEFASLQSAQRFMDRLSRAELDGLQAGYHEIPFRSKPKTAFFFYSRLTKRDMNTAHGNDLPNASASVAIPGIQLIEDFLTEAEEKLIFEAVDKREWHKLASRRVQHDGYEFVYGDNNVNPNNKLGPLPDWVQPTLKKLESYCDQVNGAGVGLDQLTINDYQPGDGIPPHVDAIGPFEEAFAAVSLGSGAVMNFRHPDGRQANVYFPPRSAVVFTGEGRLVWQHSIACRKLDRVDGKLVTRAN
jgi:alkylated DNA repair protein alkB homolog 8